MRKEMCTESVSPEKERMQRYKTFAVAFSYPDKSFFKSFPGLSTEKEKLISDYDKLFRTKEIWLYTTEYLAKNEFQRSNYLADIMGFYRAFGVEPDKDRADSLSNELEFMHYLIFKLLRVDNDRDIKDSKGKTQVCLDAQKKFFTEHLYPGAKKIAESILTHSEKNFYTEKAKEMLEFLKSEKGFLE